MASEWQHRAVTVVANSPEPDGVTGELRTPRRSPVPVVRPGGGMTRTSQRAVVISGDAKAAMQHVLTIGCVVDSVEVVDPDSGLFERTSKDEADLVVVLAPPTQVELREILVSIRFAESRWRHAGVIVLTDDFLARNPDELFERGANAILPLDARPEQLLMWGRRLAGVLPRVRVRVPVIIEGCGQQVFRRTMCQTENLSASGMLVRSKTPIDQNKTVRFDLQLPQVSSRIKGKGDAVRHAQQPNEPIEGFAVRFMDLADSFRYLMERFVAEVSSTTQQEDAPRNRSV